MKRLVTVSLIVSLVISLAAPTGAVFAVEGAVDVSVPEEAVVLSEDTVAISTSEGEVSGENENSIISEEVIDDIDKPDELPTTSVMLQEENEANEATDTPDTVISEIIPIRPATKQLVISRVQVAEEPFGRYVEIRNVSGADYQTKSLSLLYTRPGTAADNTEELVRFHGTIKAGGSVVIGDNIVRQSESQSADIYYTNNDKTTLSTSGGWLRLVDDMIEFDSFCWSANQSPACGEDRYAPKKDVDGKTVNYTVYERCFGEDGAVYVCGQLVNGENLVFTTASLKGAIARGGYVPFYNSCSGLEVSEVAPSLTDQFIELYNSNEKELSLESCILQINTRVYQFPAGGSVQGNEFLVVYPTEINTALARTTAGEVRILSSSGEVVNSLKYSTPKDDRSVIGDEYGNSVWTLKPTPGSENEYVKYASCEEGYWRNEETGKCNKNVEVSTAADCGEGRERNPVSGRCRNIPTAKEYAPCKDGQYRSEETNRCRNIALAGGTLKPCKEGQYRSEETNRCRSIASAARTLKPCADDQFRNPETNRCKKIASADELTDCGEGRERNPATNRCRNIVASTAPAIGFSPEKVQQVAGATWGWWVFGGVSILALGYAGWQWRWELKQLAIRVRSVFARNDK